MWRDKTFPEQARERQRRYLAAHAEEIRVRERERRGTRAYKDARNAYVRSRYVKLTAEQREAVNARVRAQRRADPIAARLEKQRWDGITDEGRDYMKVISRDPCVYCMAEPDTVDHIRPVSRGGDSSPMNMAPACKRCNGSKTTLDVLHFMLRAA
jgi:5-methylcytosine-specific restriction endonuclease McrA